MKDYESLLQRIKENPYDHLGHKSVKLLHPYFIGYQQARASWKLPDVHYRLSQKRFREWSEDKVHLCNQNLESFCELIAKDESDAFDLFFILYEAALEECILDLTEENAEAIEIKDRDETNKGFTLVSFIQHDALRTRPAIYFSCGEYVSGLWALCSGYLRAEKDLNLTDSSDALTMGLFQTWLDERYPMGAGQNWDKLFRFYSLGSDAGAYDKFYENFDLFMSGEKADAKPKWMLELIENAKAHFKKQQAEDKGQI